jgi:hypothetical protein
MWALRRLRLVSASEYRMASISIEI